MQDELIYQELGLWATVHNLPCWQDQELEFHPFTDWGKVVMSERLFYIRSRGISFHDAVVMALGDFKQPVGWFRLAPGLLNA